MSRSKDQQRPVTLRQDLALYQRRRVIIALGRRTLPVIVSRMFPIDWRVRKQHTEATFLVSPVDCSYGSEESFVDRRVPHQDVHRVPPDTP